MDNLSLKNNGAVESGSTVTGATSATAASFAAPGVGVAFVQAWIFWLNTANTAGVEAVAWQNIYLVVSVAMVALAFLGARGVRLLRTRWANVLSACAGFVGSALFWVSFACGNASLAALSMVVNGCALAAMYAQWGCFYAGIGIRGAVACLFAAGVVAAAVKVAVYLLPAPIGNGLGLSLPLASALLFSRARSHDVLEGFPAVHFTPGNLAGLWKVAAVISVFSLINGSLLALNPVPDAAGAWAFCAARVLEAVLCVAVLACVFGFRWSFDFARFWRVVLVVLATDIVLNVVFPGSDLQSLFSGVSLNFIVLFAWLALADIARHSSLPPVVVFGVGWACYTLPFFVGSSVASLHVAEIASPAVLVVFLYVISLVTAFCLGSRDQDIAFIFADLSQDGAAVPTDFADIDARCCAVAHQHGLTARELEVMQYLCKGRSKAYIAETLFITENTVKGHAKRLYAKLNVHSKKELQQLVDAFDC